MSGKTHARAVVRALRRHAAVSSAGMVALAAAIAVATAPLGTGGTVAPEQVETVRSFAPSPITPLSPARLLETRVGPGNTTVDGRFEGIGRIAAGDTVELVVAGRGGIADDAAAVVLNVGAILPSSDGFLTVYPCDEDRPLASNVNYGRGVVSNSVLAKIGADGKVCIYTHAAVDLIADVNSEVTVDGSPAPVSPSRVLDTRDVPGFDTVDGLFEGKGRVPAGGTLHLRVAGRGAVPPDADAVILNLGAVLPDGPGFLTVYPCGTPRPLASNVNYDGGDVVSNTLTAKVGIAGTICIYSHAATDLVGDVNGFVGVGGAPSPIDPARLLETRPGAGNTTVDGLFEGAGRLAAGSTLELDVAGRGGVPGDASTVVLNIGAIHPSGPGFVTVHPCDEQRPLASNVNYGGGDVISNGVFAKVGGDGTVCIYTLAATDLIVDVAGADSPSGPEPPPGPSAVRYVDGSDPDASDANPGTAARPWRTLTRAGNAARPGERVLIRAGTYTEGLDINVSGAPGSRIVFEAEPGQSVVLRNECVKAVGQSHIEIRGLTVRDCTGGSNDSIGIRIEGPGVDDVVIDGNHVVNTYGSAISAWGVPWQDDPGDYRNVTNIRITGNLIERANNGGFNEQITLANGVFGFEVAGNELRNSDNAVNGGEGIDVKEGSANGTIHHNVIHDIDRRAIYLDGGGRSAYSSPVHDIDVYANVAYDVPNGFAIMSEGGADVYDVRVFNNLFHDIDFDCIFVYDHPETADDPAIGLFRNFSFVNNTLANCGLEEDWREGIDMNTDKATDVLIRNNIAWPRGIDPGTATADNNVTVDPRFVDGANGDFTLRPGSPAVDRGSPTAAPAVDIAGTPRPTGAGVDVGAHER